MYLYKIKLETRKISGFAEGFFLVDEPGKDNPLSYSWTEYDSSNRDENKNAFANNVLMTLI